MDRSELTPERAAVLAVVEASASPIGPKDIHARLDTGSSYPSVKNLVRDLHRDGLIAKRGHGKYTSNARDQRAAGTPRDVWDAERGTPVESAAPAISFVIDYGDGPSIGWDVNRGRFVQVGAPGVFHASVSSAPVAASPGTP